MRELPGGRATRNRRTHETARQRPLLHVRLVQSRVRLQGRHASTRGCRTLATGTGAEAPECSKRGVGVVSLRVVRQDLRPPLETGQAHEDPLPAGHGPDTRAPRVLPAVRGMDRRHVVLQVRPVSVPLWVDQAPVPGPLSDAHGRETVHVRCVPQTVRHHVSAPTAHSGRARADQAVPVRRVWSVFRREAQRGRPPAHTHRREAVRVHRVRQVLRAARLARHPQPAGAPPRPQPPVHVLRPDVWHAVRAHLPPKTAPERAGLHVRHVWQGVRRQSFAEAAHVRPLGRPAVRVPHMRRHVQAQQVLETARQSAPGQTGALGSHIIVSIMYYRSATETTHADFLVDLTATASLGPLCFTKIFAL